MARVRSYCVPSKQAALIWISSALLFFLTFRAAMKNSSFPNSDSPASIADQRSRLYDKMARDLGENGAAFLKGGGTSQSLSLSDIFVLKDGAVTPVLKAANPPVRANVLYLSPEFATPISQAVREIFLPYFDGVIWFQNASLHHFSMFHASHHITPVVATENEIEAEASAIKGVAEVLCPLKIVLDRVVLTSTGVLLGCWQVLSGSDPTVIRAKLRNALPHAPEKQLEVKKPFDLLQFFDELVAQVNDKLRGFEATVSELWFVEEYDVLALALNGRIKTRRFHLGCQGN
ncbi:uncharacterized protein [Elaeis guineensis]|uniref:Uncharacterized protein LOC105058333 isoform X2 n=1 Tax=Elaeis guineensis var. tenera TaxID=51953 RepID=A0A6I9SH45_ELAGV|nr:uncharacterized protein LOC105058333 isoform X2 [Elaeis guineensis]